MMPRPQRFSFGSSASRSPSPIRLKASTVIRMARPGKGHDPRARVAGICSAIGQHGAPFRRRRLRTEPQEAQRRRIEDGGREARASPAR